MNPNCEPIKEMKTCKRCGKLFDPNKGITGPNPLIEPRHCSICQTRNLLDGLDMPTPPDLLDKHSRHPTLSERHFQKALSEIPDDN